MTDAVKLPPMPDPVRTALGPMKLYAEFQVRAYAIQAVMQERERCAKLMADMDCAHRCRVGNELADAIRAQPEPKA